MNDQERKDTAAWRDREIGHAGGYAPGPTLICVAALHGNEPAGVRALRRVIDRVLHARLSIRGEFAALVGNVAACKANARLLDEDMNRVWSHDRMERYAAGQELAPTAEAREQSALAQRMERLLRHATQRVVVLDYHTASSDSPPFLVLGDTLRNREFARRFPVPIVLGLEEHILGTMTEYLTERGHTAIAVEGGRHEDPASVDRLESITWLALAHVGCLDASEVPDFDLHQERLRRSAAGLESVMEIIHRHEAVSDFEMRPGYKNFQPVRAGEEVADQGGAAITSPRGARIFLPRYQPIGEDGFFLARPVNPVWLRVSAWLRKTPLPEMAARAPGVRPHPRRKNTLQLEGHLARRIARKVFHLLGYRVRAPEAGRMVLKRRHEEGPTEGEGGK